MPSKTRCEYLPVNCGRYAFPLPRSIEITANGDGGHRDEGTPGETFSQVVSQLPYRQAETASGNCESRCGHDQDFQSGAAIERARRSAISAKRVAR